MRTVRRNRGVQSGKNSIGILEELAYLNSSSPRSVKPPPQRLRLCWPPSRRARTFRAARSSPLVRIDTAGFNIGPKTAVIWREGNWQRIQGKTSVQYQNISLIDNINCFLAYLVPGKVRAKDFFSLMISLNLKMQGNFYELFGKKDLPTNKHEFKPCSSCKTEVEERVRQIFDNILRYAS